MKWQTAILTVSDKGYNGERKDMSGQVIRELAEKYLPCEIVDYRIVPDEMALISAALADMSAAGADLIFTTGGTGIGPRDVTPEATRQVIEKEIPGLAELMRMESLAKTKRAALSRGICGTRGKTLIINLPGGPAAVRENMTAVLELLPHALQVLTGSVKEHAHEG
ncbi:MAG TPA: MogA/MoaB family molybdenum cofactor biosynthesis protein [Bacilli bacterium]